MEQGYAASNRGMVALLEQRDTAHARSYFTQAQRAFVAASKRQPDGFHPQMADGEAWLSDLERVSGNYDAALAHRLVQRHILNDLVKTAPQKTRYRVDLIANARSARIAAERGRFDDALHQLDEARETANALALISPDQALKLQIRAIELFKVQTWLAMPELAPAGPFQHRPNPGIATRTRRASPMKRCRPLSADLKKNLSLKPPFSRRDRRALSAIMNLRNSDLSPGDGR